MLSTLRTGASQAPLGGTGASRIATGYLGFAAFLEEAWVSRGERLGTSLWSPSDGREWQTAPLTAQLTCGCCWEMALGQWTSASVTAWRAHGGCGAGGAPGGWAHTPVTAVGACALLPHGCVHTRSRVLGCGKGRVHCSQCFPRIKYPQTTCLWQAQGECGAWGPVARAQERLPGAPAGSPALKPLRPGPHYITDVPATRPAPLGEALLGTPSRTKPLPVGRGGDRRADAGPHPRAQPPGRRGGGQRRGRGRARGPAAEGLSAGAAVVPPFGRSSLRAGLSVLLEYARDSPSHRYTRAHTRALAHAPLFADRAPAAPK